MSLNIGFQNFDDITSFLNLIDLDSQCVFVLSSISSRKTQFVDYSCYLSRISLNITYIQYYIHQSNSILMCESLFVLYLHTHLTDSFGNKIFFLCRDSLAKQRLPCSHAFYKNLELETGKY